MARTFDDAPRVDAPSHFLATCVHHCVAAHHCERHSLLRTRQRQDHKAVIIHSIAAHKIEKTPHYCLISVKTTASTVLSNCEYSDTVSEPKLKSMRHHNIHAISADGRTEIKSIFTHHNCIDIEKAKRNIRWLFKKYRHINTEIYKILAFISQL